MEQCTPQEQSAGGYEIIYEGKNEDRIIINSPMAIVVTKKRNVINHNVKEQYPSKEIIAFDSNNSKEQSIKIPLNMKLKKLIGRVNDIPDDDCTEATNDEDEGGLEMNNDEQEIEKLFHDKWLQSRKVTFSDEITTCAIIDIKNRNLTKIFSKIVPKKAIESSFNFRKRVQAEGYDLVETTQNSVNTLGMSAVNWTHIEISSLDQIQKKSIAAYLIAGDKYLSQLCYAKAIDAYLHALRILRKSGITDEHTTMQALVQKLNDAHHITSILRLSCKVLKFGLNKESTGFFLRALKYYTVAFRLRHYALGPNHVSHATILFMIARCQAKRENFVESLLVYELCLQSLMSNTFKCMPEITSKFNKRYFDPPSTLVTLRDLGSVYRRNGDIDKALFTYQEALLLHDVRIGPSTNIKTTSRILEKIKLDPNVKGIGTEQGIEAFVASVTKNLTSNKVEDLDLAMILYSTGQIYVCMGHTNMAILLYTAAGEIMVRSLQRKDQNVAAIMGQIGNLLKECGEYDKAFDTYKNVLKIERKLLDNKDPEIAVTLHNIGTIEYFRGNYVNALDIFHDVYQIQKSIFGENHVAVAITVQSQAEVYAKIKNINSAIKAYDKVRKIISKVSGKNSIQVATLLLKISTLYYESHSNLSKATKNCHVALKIFKKEGIDDSNAQVIETNRLLGDIKALILIGI